MGLSKSERERLLAEPHIGALSVLEQPDRAPLTIPIWYQYTPGGQLWIDTSPDSRTARAIQSAGRFTLMVQRVAPTVRYVSVEGPVTGAEPGGRESAWEMAARYLPPDKVADAVELKETELSPHIVISMRPQHWISADLGPF
ncbi:MAG: pyridoxamine 5'-phosphate oxidase family protein [Mycobacterium sp.]|nr:pyridoxamine 5'-phosphate oxidase family protein [Mycobacterium sp.]